MAKYCRVPRERIFGGDMTNPRAQNASFRDQLDRGGAGEITGKEQGKKVHQRKLFCGKFCKGL